ncbi:MULTISPECIES: NADP-dependent phosphogluconate dehydrogenase [unclassified Kaistella]|uniref:NADP-dependent phosphogluconate dehydrogenase n=1 Tax=unclassified Kaistella TaxID=2762626 RepID=UPI002735FC1C|nr:MULTISPECIES: NADP-dependent phosphogluconate dehydrogenase [unclassified Kaistella]MDP2453833.1 NADP-dependent phosphogluconate dehydrogenase [Kaistella sp. SH11-4b]MDP2456890.1 NADP-dependent phosphogluconate dehydrogenase [Kaistella sp. SH40-3]MDP2459647.1 NADP-dependent phosphogluconate dehydrogenase [Kaistella sp. SH19-2b]
MEINKQNAIGMIGLGTMGSNLLQNIADHGYNCAGYDNDSKKVDALNNLNRENIQGFSDLKEFVTSLKSPRTVMMLVPAGKVVDIVISELLEVMDQGDIIIDGGNSHFIDTDRRSLDLESKGFHFIGMGVSGGEEGARRGPSMMPGGDKDAYETVAPILKQIAAQVNGEPTVAYMGERSAGHFVKMVHNGIEYALMQLISEAYEVLKKNLQLNDQQIHDVFKKWNEGRLQSYLIEITRDIFDFKKPGEDHLLLNDIKDEAKAKGTGKWTSLAAMDLVVPIPIIDIAVSMRDLSKYKDLRTQAAKIYPQKNNSNDNINKDENIVHLEEAFYFAMVSAYAQGMHLLYVANKEFDYKLNLDLIAKIWRGGCIIRSEFLEDIYSAYQKKPELKHLFLDEDIHQQILKSIPGIRKMVTDAVLQGIAVPAFSTSLSYFDNFRTEEMPANLIQAQRDFFGSHTYELKGKEGVFHTEWEETKP